MKNRGLSNKTRKALSEQIGDSAGAEIAELITRMAAEIESLRRYKSNGTGAPLGLNESTFVNIEQNA